MEIRITVPYVAEDGTPQPFDVVFASYGVGTPVMPEPKISQTAIITENTVAT